MTSDNRRSILMLPGMTLNATIFPKLRDPTIDADFTTLIASENGNLPPGIEHGMDLYGNLLDEKLAGERLWQSPTRIVVAHSFGGMLALWWLLRHNCRALARVDGLVLVATTGGPMPDLVTLRFAKLGRFEFRLGVKSTFGWWNRPLVTRSVKRALCRGNVAARRVDFSALRRRSDLALDLAGWRNTDWRAMRTFRIAMMGFDVRERLREIDVPTIVLHGSEDAIFRPAIGRQLAEALPNAEFRLVEGAAHGLPLTHPAAVVQAVDEFTA